MLRALGEYVSDKDLLDAVESMTEILGNVLEFTVILDDRPTPRAYGFLMEFDGRPGP